MHIGIHMFPEDFAIPIDELAREAEAQGFESLWVPEHTHIPASRRTPFPRGGPLPPNTRAPATHSSAWGPWPPARGRSSWAPMCAW